MHHLRTTLLTLLAVAAFPAAAQAAPHWSSPKQVVAPLADPATQNVGTPRRSPARRARRSASPATARATPSF